MSKGEEASLLPQKSAPSDVYKPKISVAPNRPSQGLLRPLSLRIRVTEAFMIVFGICGSIIMGMLPLAFYFFFGQLITALSTPDSSRGCATTDFECQEDQIQLTAYGFLIIAGVAFVGGFIQNSMFVMAGERITARIRRELFKAINRQDITYFDTTETGTLIARLSEDASLLQAMFTDKIGQLGASITQFLGGIVIALYYSWQLTLVMLCTAPLMGVAIVFQGAFVVRFTKKGQDKSAAALTVAEEVIANMRTVRSFSQEEKEVMRYDSFIYQLLRISFLRGCSQGFGAGLIQFFVWGSCALAFWYGGVLVGKEILVFGDLVTVFGMMLFACLGISVGLATLPEFAKGQAAYGRMKEVISREPAIPFEGGATLPTVLGEIELRDVCFRYSTRDVDVLNNVNLHIKPGTTVAFVGESGSGKSTIFSLIERFYEVQSGQVLIDGHDIRQLDPRWLHGYISMVSQEPVLFGTTIAENISYSQNNPSMQSIMDAAKAANAHNFIEALPDAYRTEVGERGVQLSGGQKQRVAIARAILMNPKILLLDEATSALDTESEALVQEALDRLMVGKTSLVIAHRLATVRNADSIVVLKRGTIVAQGTHDYLMEHSPDYISLARRQLDKDVIREQQEV